MSSSSLSTDHTVTCDNGHVLIAGGKLVCGRPGCGCKIALDDFVYRLIEKGVLSFDMLLKISQERGNPHCSVQRTVWLPPKAAPLVISGRDVQLLERGYLEGRKFSRGHFPEYARLLMLLAPERLDRIMAPDDWPHLAAEAAKDFGFDGLDRYFWPLRQLNPSFVDEEIARTYKALREDGAIQKLLDQARQADVCKGYVHRSVYCDRTFVLLDVLGRLNRSLATASESFLTADDLVEVEKARKWIEDSGNTNSQETPMQLRALASVFPGHADGHLMSLWPRLQANLKESGSVAREFMFKRLELADKYGALAIKDAQWYREHYFEAILDLNKVNFACAMQVADAEDWKLLMAELDEFRESRGRDHDHLKQLTLMYELQPVYAKFFGS